MYHIIRTWCREFACKAIQAIFIILILAWPQAADGDISFAKFFSDHMVLQQNSKIRIWGTATPDEKLNVTFNGETVEITTDPEGNWQSVISTPGFGGPYKIEVAAIGGVPKLSISDVMIGEVWICAGGTNMQLPISESLNPVTEIDQSKNFPDIRLVKIDQEAAAEPLKKISGVTPWEVCSPDTVKDFSAVAYFFGRELNKKLKIPIGLIQATSPGSRCESWISKTALDNDAKFAPLMRHWNEREDTTNPQRPGNLFNAKIGPLRDFGFRGVIWYQGEANVGRGFQYGNLFPSLINNWRTELANGSVADEFPFYFVQLAPSRYEDKDVVELPELWEAQLKTSRACKNTGMVVTTDIGDISNYQPKNKQEVGRRLSVWALAQTYAESLEPKDQIKITQGPIYESLAILDNKIRLTFEKSESKLVARDDDKLSGFEICGKDQKFFPAEAWIDGAAVIVTSEEVENPVAVRFAWTDTATPNFFNSDGFPASPFRTDNFEMRSRSKEF